ncbi:TPA: hypothetical protein SMP81_001422 [Proteus mirabilis]|uniref:hypothetical protein n=1 Tax=Proteus mirabilis TaxID=584 RepID=UPI0007CBBAC7|nr:hypothetical protein [Proteus mirabilis]EKU4145448.1 hypothetical protein [Proteus mirabilis]MBG5963228.1 hypothetical protein [Proteus mirabilis]MBI6255165.1 hypothetical protein [Proteus mirabilis]MBI6415848.1 hypothetical protein [Proteus mirabilis]MDC5878825.1 hypothetical protein [Proteus mirabilis]
MKLYHLCLFIFLIPLFVIANTSNTSGILDVSVRIVTSPCYPEMTTILKKTQFLPSPQLLDVNFSHCNTKIKEQQWLPLKLKFNDKVYTATHPFEGNSISLSIPKNHKINYLDIAYD